MSLNRVFSLNFHSSPGYPLFIIVWCNRTVDELNPITNASLFQFCKIFQISGSKVNSWLNRRGGEDFNSFLWNGLTIRLLVDFSLWIYSSLSLFSEDSFDRLCVAHDFTGFLSFFVHSRSHVRVKRLTLPDFEISKKKRSSSLLGPRSQLVEKLWATS